MLHQKIECQRSDLGPFQLNLHSTVYMNVYVKIYTVDMCFFFFHWLLSWLLHKQHGRLSVTNLSLENNLLMFQLNYQSEREEL